MNEFEKNVLNRLLDKYENSKLSKGGTLVNRNIKLTTKEDVFRTYNCVDSYKYSYDNDAILHKLEDKGFVKTEFSNGSFKSLTLVVENIEDIYKYLKRNNPSDELEKIKIVLDKYKFNNFVSDFIEYVREYIDKKYEYPKTYFSDSKQLDTILLIFTEILKNNEEIKKRDFSAKYLGDSKLFESLQNKIVKIIRDFDSKEYESDDDILADYNIVKNSSYVLIKNNLIIKINDTIISLDKFGFEISLSDEMIKQLIIIPSNVEKVITVENLTTFYSLKDNKSVIIYLAGYHNHTKQNLLTKIYNKYPNARYFHFGDIDAGGFWIFYTLKNKTKIPFMPYRMGVDELNRYKDNLKKLTDNDKKRLSKMLNDDKFLEFKEVIKYMLDNNVKLEQELLD